MLGDINKPYQRDRRTGVVCLLLVLAIGAAWSIGDELHQCRISNAPVEAFGTQR